MEDNLARELEMEEEYAVGFEQLQEQPYEEQSPRVEPIPQGEPIQKGLTKLEIGLISITTIIVFALVLLNVYTDFQLTNTSRSVQDTSAQIEQTEVEIENLKQHAQELSRYDRINEIANKYGLELHEENIKNLTPVE